MLRFGGANKDGNTTFRCTVRLLDDNDVLKCEFESYQKGRSLLDYVFNQLNIIETDYFGLRFIDQHKQRHWLDSNKNILRQIKSLEPILFCFRVKFYPADPLKLHEEITRYYLFLQLRRDLLHGRLYCAHNDAVILGAYIVQADLGDGSEKQLEENYVTDYKILLKQTPKIEEKITETHRSLKGISPATAELYFLKKAAALDTYGVDPYTVKDQKGVQLYLGLSHAGVLTFQGSKKTHHYKWNEVQKLNYEGRMFIIHLIYIEDARTKRKLTVGFKCSSALACRNLWRAAVEQRLFYTMHRSNKNGMVVTGGSFFSRGSKFRYQGRCEREVVEDSATIEREPPAVKRIPLKNVGRSTSLPNTPADSDGIMNRTHRPLPYIDRSTSLDEEVLCDAESPVHIRDQFLNGSYAVSGGAYCPESTLPPINQLEPLVEDTENKFTLSPAHTIAAEDDLNVYYDRPSLSYTPKVKKRELSDPNKRLQRHAAIKDDNYFPTSILGDSPDHEQSFSSDTFLQPTESSLDPFLEPKINSFYPTTIFPHEETKFKMNVTTNQTKKTINIPSSTQSQNYKADMSRYLSTLYRFSRVFFVTLFLVIVLLSVVIIFIFEGNFFLLESIRSSTELVLLRVQYYEPLKNCFISSLAQE